MCGGYMSLLHFKIIEIRNDSKKGEVFIER